jgi:TPR repeat protein
MKTALIILFALCLGMSEVKAETDKEFYEKLKALAEKGDARAQFNIGKLLDEGRGVKRNPKLSVAWYRKAAKQGNADAQTNLGLNYALGEGVKKDDKEVLKWLRKAAAQGHTYGQYNLGAMYARGKGVPVDLIAAWAWLDIAAINGSEEAKAFKGGMAPAQIKKARKLSVAMIKKNPKLISFKTWALRGDAESQFRIGQEHADGYIGDRKIRGYQAATWWRKAADQGHAKAMENLGLLYAQGKDLIQKNDVKAYAWLTLSVANGNQQLKRKLAGITKMMAPKQVGAGQELSKKLRDWIEVKRKPKAKTKPGDFVGTWHSITPPAPVDTMRAGGGEKQNQEMTKDGIVHHHWENALLRMTHNGHWKFVDGEALATIDMGAQPKINFKIRLPNIPNLFPKPPDPKGKMTKSTMSLLLSGNLIDNHGNRFKKGK